MSSIDPAHPRPFVSFADVMAKVGYFLFYWSKLEQALTEGISESKAALGQPVERVCGTFAERVNSWSALAVGLPQNSDKAQIITQIREQSMSLRAVRNNIVHGLLAGNSMPSDTLAYVVCIIGGYDNPTGESVRYSIDDLQHLTEAVDACRRGFRHVDAFNYRLDGRFQSS